MLLSPPEITTYTYDAFGNKQSETNNLGETQIWTYTAFGNVATYTNGAGEVESYTYDSDGNQLTRTDGEGYVWTQSYDANGNLTRDCDPLNNCSQSVYNVGGQLTKSITPLGFATVYAYDSFGNVVTETSTRSVGGQVQTMVTSYQYDALGRITLTTEPNGATSKTEYDARGLVEATEDAYGYRTEYVYDDQGRRTDTFYPDGASEHLAYDSDGRTTERTDRGGRTHAYEYDDRGRRTKVTFDGADTVMSYDGAGRLVSTTDRRGYVTTQAYDAVGRQISTRDALHQAPALPTSNRTYDLAGRIAWQEDAGGNRTSFTYDERGLQTRIDYPDGSFETMGYDQAGRMISKTERSIGSAGPETRYAYDAAGNLASVTNVNMAETWTYGYDPQGNLATITDPKGHVRTFEFDEQRRETSRRFHIGPSQTREYDLMGRLERRYMYGSTSAYTEFEYDSQGRQTRRVDADGNIVTWTYTSEGQRRTVTDGRGTTTYDYDSAGRLSRKTDPDGRSISYGYDDDGNLTSKSVDTLDKQWTDTFTYDELGRPVTLVAEDPFAAPGTTYTFSMSYDPIGQLETLTYPNGLVTTYEYDSLQQVEKITTRDSGQVVIREFAYTRDPDGNIATITEEDGKFTEYLYDDANRLISATETLGGSTVNAWAYEYDAAGNREEVSYTPSGGSAQLRLASYDARDRLLTAGNVAFTWDDDGRVLSKTGGEGFALTWDSEDRLLSTLFGDGTDATHVYDGDGVLVETAVLWPTGTSSASRFVVDTSARLSQIQSSIAIKAGGSTTETRYMRVGDLLVGWIESVNVYFAHGDHLSSVRGVSTVSHSNTIAEQSYEPYGARRSGGVTPQRFGFAGEPAGPKSILSQHRARYYDYKHGIFLSSDAAQRPEFFDEPSVPASGRPSRHQLYSYAASNPVNLIDPSGMFFASTTALGVQSSVMNMTTSSRELFFLMTGGYDPPNWYRLDHGSLFGLAPDVWEGEAPARFKKLRYFPDLGYDVPMGLDYSMRVGFSVLPRRIIDVDYFFVENIWCKYRAGTFGVRIDWCEFHASKKCVYSSSWPLTLQDDEAITAKGGWLIQINEAYKKLGMGALPGIPSSP